MFESKEKGMTLLEVIVTLMLISLVTGIIWTAMLTSLKYNIVETKKLQMQQDANLIITQIQAFHRKCKTYEISVVSDSISLSNCESRKDTNKLSDVTISNDYIFSSFPNQKHVDTLGMDPTMDFTLNLQDPEKSSLNVEIKTIITRYEGDL